MTPFGARLRQLRRDRRVTMKAMAAALGVSPAYLSALEHGKRGVPTYIMIQRAIIFFNIIWDEADELVKLAELSNPRVVIDTSGLTPTATEFANRLAKEIASLEAEKIENMLRFLVSKPT